MNHYHFTSTFHSLYDQAVAHYTGGQREAGAFFNAADTLWLASNGITPQHLYDYAEDQVGGGEPGFDRALGIELVRRDYFLNVQHGEASSIVLDEAALPPKNAEVRGIGWLPRIIPKARAKLHGELPATLMYCCGGDRKFFKSHDILPSEFLSVLWRNAYDDEPLIEWVVERAILAETAARMTAKG